ncbi:helix-turn-helix transcriptional regulator [Shewanella sp. 202IG2-18]|nr:helix-turn-helix transcriptional regulator [Parashewanella hymeniacidonis]
MDEVFQALAHPHRRQIIDFVHQTPGCSSGEIAALFESSRIAVAKHIKILEKAQLLLIEKSGRTKQHYFNIMPIQTVYDRWTDQYSQFFSAPLNSFKNYV